MSVNAYLIRRAGANLINSTKLTDQEYIKLVEVFNLSMSTLRRYFHAHQSVSDLHVDLALLRVANKLGVPVKALKNKWLQEKETWEIKNPLPAQGRPKKEKKPVVLYDGNDWKNGVRLPGGEVVYERPVWMYERVYEDGLPVKEDQAD